jgi:hypothetical protein
MVKIKNGFQQQSKRYTEINEERGKTSWDPLPTSNYNVCKKKN